MHTNGEGVGQDYAKAVEWYQKAAQQGSAQAQFNLGISYKDGRGVRQDYSKAFEITAKPSSCFKSQQIKDMMQLKAILEGYTLRVKVLIKIMKKHYIGLGRLVTTAVKKAVTTIECLTNNNIQYE